MRRKIFLYYYYYYSTMCVCVNTKKDFQLLYLDYILILLNEFNINFAIRNKSKYEVGLKRVFGSFLAICMIIIRCTCVRARDFHYSRKTAKEIIIFSVQNCFNKKLYNFYRKKKCCFFTEHIHFRLLYFLKNGFHYIFHIRWPKRKGRKKSVHLFVINCCQQFSGNFDYLPFLTSVKVFFLRTKKKMRFRISF